MIKNINKVVVCKCLVTNLLFTLSNNVYFSLFYLPDFMYLFGHDKNHCIFNY